MTIKQTESITNDLDDVTCAHAGKGRTEDGGDITPKMAIAGRKALAVVADRMEEAKLLATSSIDFWQRVGHEPANEIFRAMIAAASPTRDGAEGAGKCPHGNPLYVFCAYCQPPARPIQVMRDHFLPGLASGARVQAADGTGETRLITDEDLEYASELLADLTSDDLPRLEIAARWFRKARVEQSLSPSPAVTAGPGFDNIDWQKTADAAREASQRVIADAYVDPESKRIPMMSASPPVRGDREATIKECAQVAENFRRQLLPGDRAIPRKIEEAILALSREAPHSSSETES